MLVRTDRGVREGCSSLLRARGGCCRRRCDRLHGTGRRRDLGRNDAVRVHCSLFARLEVQCDVSCKQPEIANERVHVLWAIWPLDVIDSYEQTSFGHVAPVELENHDV